MSPVLLVEDIPAAKSINFFETSLKNILSAVRKSFLEPPLAESSFDAENLAQIKPANLPGDDLYKTSLETAFKRILYGLVVGSLVLLPTAPTNKLRQAIPLLAMKL